MASETYQSKYQMNFAKDANCVIINDPVYSGPVTINAGDMKKTPCTDNGGMPEVLKTEEATTLLDKLKSAGLLDEEYQPINLSRAFKAVLANTIAAELNIEKKWKVFEEFWNIRALASAYTKAILQNNVVDFIKKVEAIID